VVHALALATVVALAWLLQPSGSDGSALGGTVRDALMASATALVAIGAGLAAAARPDRRERGWELEAGGVALLGLAWVSGIAGA